MSIVQTESVTKRFGSLTAVNELTVAVDEGSVFGLLGPNGAGKTTLIKMLTTLLLPTSGKAFVCGFDVARRPGEVRRNIGYVPQLISTDGNLTGYENLLVFAKLYDIPARYRQHRILQSLEYMGLLEFKDKLVKTYSGGMIRRLEIAESMLHQPKVLFLDEPTIGLDPLARKHVWDHLSSLLASQGTTVFLTTHLMEEAESLCDKIAIMHHGRLIAVGTAEELKKAVGRDDATLDDAFIHFTGDTIESSTRFRDVARTRRIARRLG